MFRAVQALVQGATTTAGAPLLVAAVAASLLLVTSLPIISAARLLESAVSARTLEEVQPGAADARWIAQANQITAPVTGSTFGPGMFGLGIPLSNVDSLLHGRIESYWVGATALLWLAGWVFALGGIVERLRARRALSAAEFVAASRRRFVRFATLSGIGLSALAVVAAAARFAPDGVAWLVLLAGSLALLLLSTALTYARALIVVSDASVGTALARTWTLWRQGPAAIATHIVGATIPLGLLLLVVAMLDYRFGIEAQSLAALGATGVYLVLRTAGRLAWEASALALVREDAGRLS